MGQSACKTPLTHAMSFRLYPVHFRPINSLVSYPFFFLCTQVFANALHLTTHVQWGSSRTWWSQAVRRSTFSLRSKSNASYQAIVVSFTVGTIVNRHVQRRKTPSEHASDAGTPPLCTQIYLGQRQTSVIPDNACFRNNLTSRLLAYFPFLLEIWYWLMTYWVRNSPTTHKQIIRRIHSLINSPEPSQSHSSATLPPSSPSQNATPSLYCPSNTPCTSPSKLHFSTSCLRTSRRASTS